MERIEGDIYRLTKEDIAKLTEPEKGRWKPKNGVWDQVECGGLMILGTV